MSKTATQTERIVKAARSARGVCRIDFQLPEVIDGGDPILNFPGRMWDAERAGFSFEVIGKRNRCKVFRLIEVEGSAGSADERLGLAAASVSEDLINPPPSSAPLSPEVVEAEQEKPNTTTIKLTDGDAYSHPELDPEPLFKVGKAELGYADQGELDAA